MQHIDAHYLKLALKLLEVFSRQGEGRYGFERYWPLAGPVGTFSECAVGELEEDVAKALQNALDAVLAKTAPRSFHGDADSVAASLDAPPYQPPRRRKPTRTYRKRR